MKVERLTDGSTNFPLVRLFEITTSEVATLRKGVRDLADRRKIGFHLGEDCNATPIDSFELSFVAGHRDVGLSRKGERYLWVLRPESWDNVEGLIQPFTKGEHGYQWLSEAGGISLLLSPDGSW